MDLETMAAQLRKPEGEAGKQVGEAMNRSNALMNQWALEALNIGEADKVLEIGMGNGLFVKDILQQHKSVTYVGCDYSETMIEEAEKLNHPFIGSGQVQFVHAAADQLPFDSASFTKAFCVNTLYFWTTPLKELAELKRVLKKDGTLVIVIRTKETMNQLPVAQYGFIKYDREDLAALLNASSFSSYDIQQCKEPDQEWGGNTYSLENFIVTCK